MGFWDKLEKTADYVGREIKRNNASVERNVRMKIRQMSDYELRNAYEHSSNPAKTWIEEEMDRRGMYY